MRSAALVQLVKSALETLLRKDLAPLWHRLAEKKQISHVKNPRRKKLMHPDARGPGKGARRQRSTPSRRKTPSGKPKR